jgi:hypothetical protein
MTASCAVTTEAPRRPKRRWRGRSALRGATAAATQVSLSMLIRASLASPQRVLSAALTPSGCCGWPPYLTDPVDKGPKHPERVHFHGFRHPEEFDYVEASFAAFIFGDERLRSTKPFCELFLCEAGLFPRLNEHCTKFRVLCRS